MPYVTSFERMAKEEGLEEGLEKGLEKGWEKGLKRGIREVLQLRFGDEGLRLMPEIDAIRDGDLLETIMEQAGRAPSLENLQERWKPAHGENSGSSG